MWSPRRGTDERKCLLKVSEVNKDGNYYVGTNDSFEGDVSVHCLAIVQYVDPRIQVGNLTLAVHLNGVTELFVVDDTVVVRVLFEKSIEKLRFVVRQVASVVVDQSRYEVLGDVEFEMFHGGSICNSTEGLNPYGVELVKVNLHELGFAELKVD